MCVNKCIAFRPLDLPRQLASKLITTSLTDAGKVWTRVTLQQVAKESTNVSEQMHNFSCIGLISTAGLHVLQAHSNEDDKANRSWENVDSGDELAASLEGILQCK